MATGSKKFVRRMLAIAMIAGSPSCTPLDQPRTSEPLATTDVRGSARIDVRRMAARPHLALVTRDGDPSASVAVAIRSAGGATTATVANAALAALVRGRLQLRGHPATVESDAASIRLLFESERAAKLEDTFAAVATAMAMPVAPREDLTQVDAAMAELRSLRAHSHMALLDRCDGRRSLASHAPLPDFSDLARAADLEGWRRATFVTGAVAIGIVGPESVTRTAVDALARTAFALGVPGPQAEFGSDSHGVVRDTGETSRTARLELAWRLADPTRATASVLALQRRPSPLSSKLAQLDPPHRIVSLHATALGDGGCVRLSIEPETPSSKELRHVVTTAARAAAIANTELAHELGARIDQDLVLGLVGANSDGRDTAILAAWWALAGTRAGALRTTFSSVLVLGAEDRAGAVIDESELSREFEVVIARESQRRTPVVEARLSVEAGQGQFWLLIANPCALASETEWDAGHAALAMIAAVDTDRGDDATLEAWIDPAGIGVLAHAPQRVGDADGLALAERVAGIAAAAYRGSFIAELSLTRARTRLVNTFDARDLKSAALLADHLVPNHPSWLMPLAAAAQSFTFSATDAERKLRELGTGKVRVAILANQSSAQADAAVAQVARWLPVDHTSSTECENSARPETPQGGEYFQRTRGPDARILVGARADSPDVHGVEILAAALTGEGGILARALGKLALSASAMAVGGARAATLLVDVRVVAEERAEALTKIKEMLRELRRDGLQGAELLRAEKILSARAHERRHDPRTRLAELFRDAASRAPSDASLTNRMALTLAEDRLVFVIESP
ncbi:MAG: hypothetical protein EXR75_08260 [Myxococcales bacterium]|nr:hypothetical protein [Myxococcales bacterium]